ncbi:hypothetical protein [uncultured Chryseobacterium sp.]|uniref:hypothetical protein n=1 Tax=uncultured Chryseobacterium sp. TaxID=259322 RepID=UPI0025CD7002|nr:hypothetical protein [uncultured Chryseobacterium sp.]
MKDWIGIIADIFTIVASGIAIYLFIINKDKISSAINLMLNYSKQITLADLKYKIERLNDYTTTNDNQKQEVINILSDIEGQINGNPSIKIALSDKVKKISKFIESPINLTEPKKRSLVSELRESVRHIDVTNYNEIIKK